MYQTTKSSATKENSWLLPTIAKMRRCRQGISMISSLCHCFERAFSPPREPRVRRAWVKKILGPEYDRRSVLSPPTRAGAMNGWPIRKRLESVSSMPNGPSVRYWHIAFGRTSDVDGGSLTLTWKNWAWFKPSIQVWRNSHRKTISFKARHRFYAMQDLKFAVRRFVACST